MGANLTPPTTTDRRKLALIASGGILALAVIGVTISTASTLSHKAATIPSPSPSAGATATPAPTPTPSDAAKAPTAATVVGTDDLLAHGATYDQLDDLRFALNKYGATLKPTPTTITLSSIIKAPHDRTGNGDTATFNVTFDGRTTLSGRMVYFDLSVAHIYLTTLQGAQVFDSGDIDLYNGVGD